MKERLKRLYPPYLCALLLMLSISFARNGFSVKWLLKHLYETKWQFLFLHHLGAKVPFEMRSIWFLSVFVVVSYLVYFLLAYNHRLFLGLSPVGFILIMVHIFVEYGSLSMQGAYEGWVSGGIMRGFAEMSIGAYLYYANKPNEKKRREISEWHNSLIGIAEILILFAILSFMKQSGFDENDFFILFLLILFIRLSLLRTQRYSVPAFRRAVIWLGSINYWMFLVHLIISRLVVKLAPNHTYWHMLLVYIALVIIISSVMQALEKWVRSRWTRRKTGK